jgi:hypothetical protein
MVMVYVLLLEVNMSRERTSAIWKISKEQFDTLVKESETYTEILKYFNLKNKGNNHRTLKIRIKEECVDVSHLKKNFYKMVQKNISKKTPLIQIMVVNSDYNRSSLKRRMLNEGILIDKCDICGQEPEWKGKSLVMVLDHINGNSTDNRKENLRLLCPNCNSQQKTFAGRNNIKHDRYCKTCNVKIFRHNSSGLCLRCFPRKRKIAIRPEVNVLKKQVDELGYLGTGRLYGVSDNSIRKWIGV